MKYGPHAMTMQAPHQIGATVGANIRSARKAANLTQRQLAQRVNDVDPLAVSRWERGESRPNDMNFAALAATFGVPIAWFYMDHSTDGAVA